MVYKEMHKQQQLMNIGLLVIMIHAVFTVRHAQTHKMRTTLYVNHLTILLKRMISWIAFLQSLSICLVSVSKLGSLVVGIAMHSKGG